MEVRPLSNRSFSYPFELLDGVSVCDTAVSKSKMAVSDSETTASESEIVVSESETAASESGTTVSYGPKRPFRTVRNGGSGL